MARAAPVPAGSGSVRCPASQVLAWPMTSAWMRAPRASACSRSSSTRMPAPSPITNPSRSASNGREASGDGRSVVLSAPSWRYPATSNGVRGASAPPASTRSARPSRMSWRPAPIASVPAAQAVPVTPVGPRTSSVLATAATGALVSPRGMVRGLTRAGPRAASVCSPSCNVWAPPCTQPMTAPIRSAGTPWAPASSSADAAARAARRPARSMRRASRWPKRASRGVVDALDGKGRELGQALDDDALGARRTGEQGAPEGVGAAAERADDADAGDYDAGPHARHVVKNSALPAA